MAIKLVDELKAMGNFPIAHAEGINLVKTDGTEDNLQNLFDNGELGGGDDSTTLTQQEYEALTEEQKLDGLYYTYDTKRIYKNGVQYGASEPISLTMAEYKALKEAGAIDEQQEYLIEANAEGILLGAEDIGYNNAESGIQATTVQGAIDKVVEKVDRVEIKLNGNINHNIPRLIPKDITSYYTDGTLWDRLEGTNGFSLFEDIFVGDYIKMSRAISAYNQDQNYQLTGSQYVTIAGIDTLWGNGDNILINYHHLIMIPGQGFGGTQHFGRSRMNTTHTTEGGYVVSEMHTTTLGSVTTSASTETTATINQQLYAEFGSHLKTTRELLSNAINSTGYNRFGSNTGCSNGWSWTDCQAILMSEIEVYGSIVWSSSGYDTGNANKQLPLFVNSKQAINNRGTWYWLKDVASASDFCGCNDYGDASCYGAGHANGCVRPRFVIAK